MTVIEKLKAIWKHLRRWFYRRILERCEIHYIPLRRGFIVMLGKQTKIPQQYCEECRFARMQFQRAVEKRHRKKGKLK